MLFHCFSEKIKLDISCESSAEDSHEKNQALFYCKIKTRAGCQRSTVAAFRKF